MPDKLFSFVWQLWVHQVVFTVPRFMRGTNAGRFLFVDETFGVLVRRLASWHGM
jgi:hypothetical protein